MEIYFEYFFRFRCTFIWVVINKACLEVLAGAGTVVDCSKSSFVGVESFMLNMLKNMEGIHQRLTKKLLSVR